jgi:hypothetical protein
LYRLEQPSVAEAGSSFLLNVRPKGRTHQKDMLRGLFSSLNRVQSLPAVNQFIESLVYQPAHLLGGHMLSRLSFA